ncbi:MAG TPA: aspartyl protease family protein, partial [Gemmatimonadaceae bacterium]|nr:aspartyl protease family protein [Gemmatimonadaceae bacterium]
AEFSMWPNGDVMVVLSNYDPPAATTIAQFIRQMEQEGDAASTLRVLDSLWARAYEKQDTALALRLYSANLAFTSSDGTVKTRDDEMADVRPQAGFVMNFFRTTPTEIRVSGDSGYVSGVAEWSFTAGGGTRQIRRAYSLTAQRSAAMGWTIVAVRMGAAPAVPNPGAVEIPLTKIGPFYYVDVRLNGKPFRFTLETGASFAAISTRAAKQLGLSADGARLDSLSFGTVTLRDVEARVTTLFDNAEFDGILSLPLLRDYVWTMDLARSRLILERGSLPAPNGRDVLPIAGKDRAQRLDIPMALGGQQVSAVLDTRYAGWVMTNDSLLPGVRLASPLREVGTARGPSLGEFRMRGARLVDAVDVGRYSLPQAPVVFRNVGGTIVGAAFLEQFAVTVDQVNGRIRFTRADSAIVVPAQPWEREGAQSTGATDAPTRTFGFRVAARPDGRLFIVQLDTASAAARLGIRENDEIVEFDGVPAARMNPQIYRTALARGGAVTIAVLRDGKRLDFSVESQMP